MEIKEYTITIESIQNMMKLIILKLKNNTDNQNNLIEQILKYIERIRNIYQKLNNSNFKSKYFQTLYQIQKKKK